MQKEYCSLAVALYAALAFVIKVSNERFGWDAQEAWL